MWHRMCVNQPSSSTHSVDKAGGLKMAMVKRNRTLGKAVAILAVAALALVVTPFQAGAVPVLGGTIVAAGGDVMVAFVSSSASFRSFLQFYSPTTGTLVAGNINNSDARSEEHTSELQSR